MPETIHELKAGLKIKFLINNKALRYEEFRFFMSQRFLMNVSMYMQNTILVYWLYSITSKVWSTGDAVWAIGKLGLFEAIPAIGFSLFAGHFTDQLKKKQLLVWCFIGYIVLSSGYAALSYQQTDTSQQVRFITNLAYTGFFVNGLIRSFLGPSTFSLLGQLIPKKQYANAAMLSSTAWQIGAVLGPLTGGLLIAHIPIHTALAMVAVIQFVALLSLLRIKEKPVLQKEREPIMQSLKQGLSFVFNTQIVLAALALDMFAVLFGGAIALLPVFSKDILHVGEMGYGWLRAAPGIGSMTMLFIFAWIPIKKKPGVKLLFSIGGFGIAIICFGLSKIFTLSFAMLLISGMLDAVSVVIRGTILQLYTPENMRGRVSAVNTMFISSSNEIGEVESGFTAKLMGTVPAVVFGGCMTLIVVGVTWFVAPKLRTLKLEAPEEAA